MGKVDDQAAGHKKGPSDCCWCNYVARSYPGQRCDDCGLMRHRVSLVDQQQAGDDEEEGREERPELKYLLLSMVPALIADRESRGGTGSQEGREASVAEGNEVQRNQTRWPTAQTGQGGKKEIEEPEEEAGPHGKGARARYVCWCNYAYPPKPGSKCDGCGWRRHRW